MMPGFIGIIVTVENEWTEVWYVFTETVHQTEFGWHPNLFSVIKGPHIGPGGIFFPIPQTPWPDGCRNVGWNIC